MKIKFTIPIPMRDRWKILWHGSMCIMVDYRGVKKKMRIEAFVPTSGELKQLKKGE